MGERREGGETGRLDLGQLVRTFDRVDGFVLVMGLPKGPAGFISEKLIAPKKPIAVLAKDYPAARHHAESALALFEPQDDLGTYEHARRVLAEAYALSGDHRAAGRIHWETLEIVERAYGIRTVSVDHPVTGGRVLLPVGLGDETRGEGART